MSNGGRPLAFFTPGLTPEGRPTALARHGLKNRRTGANFDLLPADEAPSPADDAGTASIIVGTP